MTSSTTNYFKFTFVCCFVVFNEKKTYNLHIIVYMDLPPGIIPKKKGRNLVGLEEFPETQMGKD